MGKEKVKNIQKANKILLVFGGNSPLPSPKGPEKNTELNRLKNLLKGS